MLDISDNRAFYLTQKLHLSFEQIHQLKVLTFPFPWYCNLDASARGKVFREILFWCKPVKYENMKQTVPMKVEAKLLCTLSNHDVTQKHENMTKKVNLDAKHFLF